MIKVSLETLVNSTEGLQGLSRKPLKARTAYAVAKLLKAADAEMNTFNETRMTLIRKYGVKDENGELEEDENKNVRVMPEYIEAFTKELNELLNTEVEFNANKIKLEDLGDIDFTPNEMVQLEEFIEFDE